MKWVLHCENDIRKINYIKFKTLSWACQQQKNFAWKYHNYQYALLNKCFEIPRKRIYLFQKAPILQLFFFFAFFLEN